MSEPVTFTIALKQHNMDENNVTDSGIVGSSQRYGVTFIDDASFYKPNYNRNDLDTFAEFFREVFPTQETEYNLNLYGQEGRYYEHKSGDYRGAIQTLADASFAGDLSDSKSTSG